MREPGEKVAECSLNVPGAARCVVPYPADGRSWMRWPPLSTAITCIPRQMPRTGSPRSRAAR